MNFFWLALESFSVNQIVKVTEGYFQDYTGKVVGYDTESNSIVIEFDRKINGEKARGLFPVTWLVTKVKTS